MRRQIAQYCEHCLAKSALLLCIAFLTILLLCSCARPPHQRFYTARAVLGFIDEEGPCSGDAEVQQQTSHIEHKDIQIHVRRAECIWIREYLRIRATMVYPADSSAVLMPAHIKFHGVSTIRSHGKSIDIRRELQAAAILISTVAETDSVEKQCIIAEYNIDWAESDWVMGHYSFIDVKRAKTMEGSDAVDLCVGIVSGDTIDLSVMFKCCNRRKMDRWIHDSGLHSSFIRKKIKDKSACNIVSGYLEIPFFDAEGQPLFQGKLTFQLDPEKSNSMYWSKYLWRVDMRLPNGEI